MNPEWNKWLLATAILSMTIGSAPVGAAGTAERTIQSAIGFSDQGSISPAKRAAVEEAVKQGLLSGYPDASFRPNQLLTRQELAVLLVKALHLEPKQGASSSFADLKDGWAVPYVEALVEAGLINGDESSRYRPSEPVTREELAAVFVRAINGVDARGGNEVILADGSNISPWADKAVSLALHLGLMNAEGNAFNPRGNVERQDIAAYLLDIFQTREQSAAINRIDGDMVIIDGKPYLISGALKDLLGERNQDALEGAVLKYKSVNHNVNDLLRIELTKGGTAGKPAKLDLKGTSFKGELAIAADHIAVDGDSLTQVVLKPGAGTLVLNAKIAQVLVDTDSPLKVEGNGTWGELKIADPDANLKLGPNLTIDKLQGPEGIPADKLIANYDEVKKQIAGGAASGGTPATPGSSGSGSSGSSGSSDSPSNSNRNPVVVNALAPLTHAVDDGPKTLSLAGVFADADGDVLTHTALSSDTGVATASVSGTDLTITPVNAGTSTITVTADDGKGGTKSLTFIVTFQAPAPVNEAPVISNPISNITESVTAGVQTVSLARVFYDADGDALTHTAVSSDTGVATVSVSGTDLTITPVNAGTSTITVTADDGKGGTKSLTFTVTFQAPAPVNEAPVISNPISNLTESVTAGVQTVSLARVFYDADGDALTHTAGSSDTGVATASVSGTDLTITPVNAGTSTITVTADDGKGGTKSLTFTVTFQAPAPVNEAPVISNPISNLTESVAAGVQTVRLARVFYDADGDALTHTAVSSDTGVATASVSGTDLTITPVNAGTSTITVTADDGKGGTKSLTFTVTFQAPVPANEAPVISNPISNITESVTAGVQTVSLARVFYDADGDALTHTAVSSDTGVATASVSGTDLTITPVNAGTSTITVTADDGKGGTKSLTFTVTFQAPVPANEAPVISNPISNITESVTAGVQTVSLARVFYDADGDVLTHTAVSSDTGVATASVSGTDLTITPVNAGTSTITVTADDGKGGTKSLTFNVTITAAAPTGLFISETLYASDDIEFGLQAIELYNPTNEDIDGDKVKIVRSDGIEDIVLNSQTLRANSTFVIMEAFYSGPIQSDFPWPMMFYDDPATPVQLSLYYNDQLLDIAYIYPHQTFIRKATVTKGNNTAYDGAEWIGKGKDFVDDIGKFNK
ncbi:S-layer homology domain-containing protein [Paenibacillus sp. FJAT-26967]|uniref:Ig-like domain-containing protein n=1 Tax=Paenibacillus sp. FJAT-26967 TaxID=1729690 RepID=UPI000837F9E4|nr:S-layer homology domain-containing protein [Paenibacillus sp. FJAT-26967]